jgi:sugar phosphate isomerase/epimerase
MTAQEEADMFTRRELLIAASVTAVCGAQTTQEQTFPAGLVPGGGPGGRGGRNPGSGSATLPSAAPPPAPALESFWRICDECQKLGVHHIEINNTNRKIVEAYESRIAEFREEMAKRGLTLLGSAMYSHMHLTGQRTGLIEMHVRVARFLKATGGKYMNPLIAPGDNLGNGTDEQYRAVDVKAWAANANEIGKRVTEETGIAIGLHPEQGDIRAGLIDRFMDATDSRHFNLWPDVGHFVACGVDPMSVYKRYRSRMVGTHLRDFQPISDAQSPDGQPPRGRMVAFGTGVIKLPELVGYLRETKFTGPVMGEGGGNQAMRDYMVDTLKLNL